MESKEIRSLQRLLSRKFKNVKVYGCGFNMGINSEGDEVMFFQSYRYSNRLRRFSHAGKQYFHAH